MMPSYRGSYPMRISHLLAYYGNYFGGIQYSVGEVAKRQLNLGHKVEIISSDMFGSRTVVENVPVKRLKTLFEIYRVPFAPSLPFTLLKEQCDILHVYLPLPWFDLCATAKKKLHPNTKLILSIRNLLPNMTSMGSRIGALIHEKITIKIAIDKADAVIFTNEDFANSLPYDIPREKKFIVPNGTNTDVFYPDKDFSYNPNQVLFVGRLVPEKGLDILVDAVKLAKKELPEIKLIAVVSDYYRQTDYLNKILNLDENFLEIRSGLPLNELAQLYRNSAIFVLPSIGLESFGNVLVEAMASGCPVISSDLPGPRGLVESGSPYDVGSVVPRNDARALANAIIRELERNNHERRRKIAKFASMRASWDTITKQLISVYENCG